MIFESISVWIASWYWVAPPLTPPFLSLPLLWLLLPQGSSDQPLCHVSSHLRLS